MVSLATKGIGVKSFVSGILSTGVLINSTCASSRGGTSRTSPPTSTIFAISGKFSFTVSVSSSTIAVSLLAVSYSFVVLFPESTSSTVDSSGSEGITISIVNV